MRKKSNIYTIYQKNMLTNVVEIFCGLTKSSQTIEKEMNIPNAEPAMDVNHVSIAYPENNRGCNGHDRDMCDHGQRGDKM